MVEKVTDLFSKCVDVSADVRADLANNVYHSRYLPLFMTLVHESNHSYRDFATQHFLSDVAARYAHSDINNENEIRNGLLTLFDQYLAHRRIIDFDVNSPFFQVVNRYYIEHLGGKYNPARFRNYVNGYLLTDVIESEDDVELAINNSILHNDASCQ
ncbi:hypothetical protein [Nicoliella lavandulae]|uniref:Uncharacterized protein n=1 Tax=Nicoliella lavandulae TaxID=3082954 RepID=A0ABU8SMS5_9LACO